MAIGFTPIIPMNPIQANPDARFQRFGTNDSQLFGKPMLTGSVAPKTQSPQVQLPAVTPPATAQAPVHKLPEVGSLTGEGLFAKTSVSPFGHLGQAGNQSGMQKTPQPGSQLDIKV